MLGESLAKELFIHFKTEGYIEEEKVKGVKDAAKPTEKLIDTIKVNPEIVVPQNEVFVPIY